MLAGLRIRRTPMISPAKSRSWPSRPISSIGTGSWATQPTSKENKTNSTNSVRIYLSYGKQRWTREWKSRLCSTGKAQKWLSVSTNSWVLKDFKWKKEIDFFKVVLYSFFSSSLISPLLFFSCYLLSFFPFSCLLLSFPSFLALLLPLSFQTEDFQRLNQFSSHCWPVLTCALSLLTTV